MALQHSLRRYQRWAETCFESFQIVLEVARMSSFWQDVKYSLRMIAKAPGYAAIAILTLALGIGANTTIFSWINATLLNPIPGLASPRDLVTLSLSESAENPFPFNYPDVEAMRNGQQSFAG